jgi:hypothetical protein
MFKWIQSTSPSSKDKIFKLSSRYVRVFETVSALHGSLPIACMLISLRLRKMPTSRKVAGSIPDGVTGIFRWHNPSGRTMALGLTQPLMEISTRNISWG